MQSSSSGKRILVFDALKLFAIFLVIWGHCLLHLQGYKHEIMENPLYRFITSFHMPLFMSISGYFASKSKGTLINKIKNKFHQLIVPSLTFGVIFVLSWGYIAEGGALTKNYILCYWFLKSAFICSGLYFISLCFKPFYVGVLLTLVVSQFLFIYQVNYMYPCFLCGVLMEHYHTGSINKSKWILFISMIIYIALLSRFTFNIASHPLFRFYRYILSPTNVILSEFGYHLYKVFLGLSGSIAFISLFITIGKIIPHSKIGDVLCGWGTYTLGIYFLQAIFVEHLMMKSIDLSSMSWIMFNFIVTPLLSVIVLCLCIVVIKLMRRSRIVRVWIFGEKS